MKMEEKANEQRGKIDKGTETEARKTMLVHQVELLGKD